jgi:hypothetical protein
MSEIVKFNLRLPKSLHRRLQRDAAKNNVSLNTEMVNQLEGSKAALVRDLVEAARPELKDIAAEAAGLNAVLDTMAGLQARLSELERRQAAVAPQVERLEGRGASVVIAETSPASERPAGVTAFDPTHEPVNPSRHYDAPRKRRDKSA